MPDRIRTCDQEMFRSHIPLQRREALPLSYRHHVEQQMGFEPMNTEVAALPLHRAWVPLHVSLHIWCQQDSNLQHACLSYVTAFKDRKLFQLSYDIMYDGFSHFRVFPCLVIIHTTNNPYSLCQFTTQSGNLLGLSLMSLPNSRRGTFKWWPGQDSNLRLQI